LRDRLFTATQPALELPKGYQFIDWLQPFKLPEFGGHSQTAVLRALDQQQQTVVLKAFQHCHESDIDCPCLSELLDTEWEFLSAGLGLQDKDRFVREPVAEDDSWVPQVKMDRSRAPHSLFLIQPYLGKSLAQHLLQTPFIADTAKIKALGKSLIHEVGKLHEKQIMHGDLKLENVLIDENGDLLLIDYAFARLFNEPLPEVIGSIGYRRPESRRDPVSGHRLAAPEDDYHALGVLLHLMLEPFSQSEAALTRATQSPLAQCRSLDQLQQQWQHYTLQPTPAHSITPLTIKRITLLNPGKPAKTVQTEPSSSIPLALPSR